MQTAEVLMWGGVLGGAMVLLAHCATALRWKVSVVVVQAVSGVGGGLLAVHLLDRAAWGPAVLNALWVLTSAAAIVRVWTRRQRGPVVWSMAGSEDPRAQSALLQLERDGIRAGATDGHIDSLVHERLTPLGEDLRIIRRTEGGMVFCNSMAPGSEGPPVHAHSCEQLEYVVRGRLVFVAGHEQRELAAGQWVLLPIGTFHTFRPAGDEGALVASVVTGAANVYPFLKAWHGSRSFRSLSREERDKLERDLWRLGRTWLADDQGGVP
jgi:mannose-6-phosphate isomerase-like protein (cupin superfamily)